ncbi:unnamed protein product [Prorocentrum cordatum]|uniref:Uncharacterized protein n=1 Tax=Prorocentrum cordatum TaxID=2364126 RepID=A0ABN9SRK1_9DINO|nr:unnamed protein product [Polarella glacialis]
MSFPLPPLLSRSSSLPFVPFFPGVRTRSRFLAATQETAVKTAAFPWQDAHLLSQYFSPPCAQPVPPAAVPDGPTEHSDGDIAETHSEVIVEVTGCQDAMTNGTYVWIGVSNLRPVYRLLGPEPRYLHYTEVSVASGWQIVSKMGGAQEPVERFRGSLDDSLPVHCKAGDLGSRVVDTGLSAQVAGRISMISCGEERTTIRSKLAAVFGRYFTQLEAQHRVLASGSPAVVSVACTLEAQQRAVRRIGGQLAAEVQRREAAEAQLRCVEEAFETLQLRMQAQLPQRPACAALVAAPPAGAPPLPRRRPASPGGAALGGGGAAAGPAGGAPAAGVAG